MGYKTIFDPDDKGLGLRIPPEILAKQMVKRMLETFNDNRTVIKTKFKKQIEKTIGKYDYEINLCGRKQPLSQFCGNIANIIMDIFFEEQLELTEKKKAKS